ncbi:MAG: hypothetical protein SOR59_05635 [Lachnospiraceae bacterium]|nr:hypothetical protein [Lachnospiraceae bacterium]
MIAIKCDRCGQLYEYYDGGKTFKDTEKANAIKLIDKDWDNDCWYRKTYDLCPDCMREFEDFLKGKSYESD